jgi:hypothetical protein
MAKKIIKDYVNGVDRKLVGLGNSHADIVVSKTAIDSYANDCGAIALDAVEPSGVHASALFEVNGNVAGAEYWKLTSSALVQNVVSEIYTKTPIEVPARAIIAPSISQRIYGEEHYVEMVSVDANGVPETTGIVETPLTITAFRVISNVAYVTVSSAITGKIRPLDRIVIAGMADSRLNIGAVAVTTVWETKNQFLVPMVIADGIYTVNANSKVYRISPTANAQDAAVLLFEGTDNNTAIPVVKNAGSTPLIGATTSFGTAYSNAIQSSVQPYTESFTPRFLTSINLTPQNVEFVAQAIDGLVIPIFFKRSQSVPNMNKEYVIRARSYNLPNKSVPIANIVSVSKSGTTTATVTLDAAPEIPLTTSDWLTAYGVTDTANFPNLAAQAQVASIISPTQFTIIWGGAATSASFGGVIVRNNGSVTAPAQALAARGIARDSNGYMMIAASAAPTVLVGDTVRLVGCRDNVNSLGVDGRYKVLQVTPNIWFGNTTNGSPVITGVSDTSQIAVGALVSGTGIPASSYVVSVQAGVGFTINANCTATSATPVQFTMTGMIVEAIGTALQPSTGGSLTATTGLIGGAVIKETDLRIHFIKLLDYNRMQVESFNNNDVGESFPAYLTGGILSALTTLTNLTNLLNGQAAHGGVITGAPVRSAGVGYSAWAANVANGTTANLITDLRGRQITKSHAPRELHDTSSVVLTTTTETTLIASVASTFQDIHALLLSNTSATDTRVDLRDATAGATIRPSILLKAGATQLMTFDPPLKQTTAGNNWTAQLSIAATDVRITAVSSRY